MAHLGQLIQRFEGVDTRQVIQEAFDESAESYADLNASQMFSGVDKDGELITPGYKPLTIEIKKLKGQPVDRVTLRDTGSFYKGIYARLDGTQIYVDSKDEKSKELQFKYGEFIFGLTTDNTREFVFGPFWSVLKQKLNDRLQLSF
jgi:hypothetical protein